MRKKSVASRTIAQHLYRLKPGEFMFMTDLAQHLTDYHIGTNYRKWYVRIAQLFTGGAPARKYLNGFYTDVGPTGYMAIYRERIPYESEDLPRRSPGYKKIQEVQERPDEGFEDNIDPRKDDYPCTQTAILRKTKLAQSSLH